MRENNFTLEEISHCLGIPAGKIDKLAKTGQLPGDIVDGVWRFNRIRFVSWLQQNIHTIDGDRLSRIEMAIGHVFREPDHHEFPTDMLVSHLIPDEGVNLSLPARTRQSVLSELVRLADQTGLLYDGEQLLAELQLRESDCSTALSRGVAVPHSRRPLPYATERPLICMGRVPGGIGYGQANGGLSYLFFMICYHEDAHHLRVLARLTRMLDSDTVHGLLASETTGEALEVLRTREEQVLSGDR